MAPENLVPSLSTVATTVLRLSISSCTVWLLSANVLENDDVFDSSDCRVPPSPWNTWMSAALSALTSCGLRPCVTGFSPPSSRSMSSAGAVRSSGISAPAGNTLVDPGPSTSSR